MVRAIVKMLSYNFYADWYSPSNSISLVFFILHDFDLHFQSHEFWNVIILNMVRASKKCSSITFIEVDSWHRIRPIIANAVLCDLDLNFQGHRFKTFISRKCWELSQNASYDFAKVNICHRMVPLWMLYSVTFTNIFKVKHFLVMHML